jgi:cytochrome c553
LTAPVYTIPVNAPVAVTACTICKFAVGEVVPNPTLPPALGTIMAYLFVELVDEKYPAILVVEVPVTSDHRP